ncbi:MAG: uroporphyrinogen decarboxylase [Clostridiales bacterium]|nr:uroporphyrinogen decarboxylase [Clostridiales bacterium]
MNKKQRVINSLNHKESDIIPYEISFTIPLRNKLIKYFNDPDFESKINNHIIMMDYSTPHIEDPDKPEHFTDQWGVVWNRSGPDKDIGNVENQVVTESNAYCFDLPVIDFDELGKRLEKFSKSNQNVFKAFNIGFSLFERAWTLRGMESLLMDMVTNPQFVHNLLDRICDFNISLIEFSKEYDIDGICFGDDWGQQNGLITGPIIWREFIKPRLKRAYAAVKNSGRFVMQHSCGDISEILPDVIECGLDCYQTFQPEIYNIQKVKSEFGNDLSFWGAISTQGMLPFETPDGVRRETARIMKILGKGGGYIASPTHAVPYDVPEENIKALLDIFANQNKYL